MPSKTALFAPLLVFTMACAPNVDDQASATSGGDGGGPSSVQLGPSNARWSFEFPGGGTPNDNGPIGPFCCTGETGVATEGGQDLGYGYFFRSTGQAYTDGEDYWVPDVEIEIAAVTDLADPSSALEQSKITFDGATIEAGSSVAVAAGALLFTATIEQVATTSQDYVDVGQLKVRLDVDPLD